MGMAHLVAFERRSAPWQDQPEREDHQQAPQRRLQGIDPARAGHPEAHAAPYRTRQAVAPRAIDRELPEQIEEGDQGNAGERLIVLGLETDQKIAEIDRHQDRERDQKSDQQLLAAAGIFGGIAIDQCVGPEMAADVGEQPEPIEAEGDEFQRGAALDQIKEFAAAAGKRHRHRRRHGRRRRWRHLRGPAHLVHGSTPARGWRIKPQICRPLCDPGPTREAFGREDNKSTASLRFWACTHKCADRMSASRR